MYLRLKIVAALLLGATAVGRYGGQEGRLHAP
jgi:hypothetical protein